MTRFLSRGLVPVTLIVGLAGCGKSNPPAQAGPEASPKPGVAVTSDDVDRVAPGQPIEQLLMDKFPGVEVQSRPGGGVALRIRGVSSFYGSSEPLLVVDGVTIDQAANDLRWLNPHDIANITVLKNPAETAIYGVRGGNGVIVITTKRRGK